jgi:hypothetical protein
MTMVERVVHEWKSKGVELNAPAPLEEQRSLEKIIDSALPHDIREFYSAANGMRDNAIDEWSVSFWSIAKMCREFDVVGRENQRWIAFGDVLLNSWFFRFCPDQSRTRVFVESTQEVFDTLDKFFDAYASRPTSLGLVRAG